METNMKYSLYLCFILSFFLVACGVKGPLYPNAEAEKAEISTHTSQLTQTSNLDR